MSECCGNIEWSECARHTEIRFTGTDCPVCAAEENTEQLLGKIFDQQNQIASLEMLRATATAD